MALDLAVVYVIQTRRPYVAEVTARTPATKRIAFVCNRVRPDAAITTLRASIPKKTTFGCLSLGEQRAG
jgi:hypothetical protein